MFVAHHIDLVFEDIDERHNVVEVISNARKDNQFHLQLWLVTCKIFCRDVGATRFITNYIVLDKLLKKGGQFKETFYEWWWTQSKLSYTKIK